MIKRGTFHFQEIEGYRFNIWQVIDINSNRIFGSPLVRVGLVATETHEDLEQMGVSTFTLDAFERRTIPINS